MATMESLQPKKVIVRFHDGVGRSQRNEVHHRVGGQFVRELVSICVDLVVITSRVSVAEAAAKYQKDERVLYAEQDRSVSLEEKE